MSVGQNTPTELWFLNVREWRFQPPGLGDREDAVIKALGGHYASACGSLGGAAGTFRPVCPGCPGLFRSDVAASAGARWSRVPRPVPTSGPLSCFLNSELTDLNFLPRCCWFLRRCSPFTPWARLAGLVSVTHQTLPRSRARRGLGGTGCQAVEEGAGPHSAEWSCAYTAITQ